VSFWDYLGAATVALMVATVFVAGAVTREIYERLTDDE